MQEQLLSAARRLPGCPLGHEGLATLALRKLNRQPSGVPSLWRHCSSESEVVSPHNLNLLRQYADRSTEKQQSLKPELYHVQRE